jgi:hypothetical protein
MKRYDDSTDLHTPEEIKQFYAEFSRWLQELGIKSEESWSKLDELEVE